MYNQNDSQFDEPVQSSNNIWTIIGPIVITALVVGGGVYAWQRSNLKSTEQNLQQQIENLQNQLEQYQQAKSNQEQPLPAQDKVATQPATQSEISKNENNTSPSVYTNWKTYRNNSYGFEFKYNANWSIALINAGSGYNTLKPFVLLWAGSVSDAPCQGLGCLPHSGDRDELTKGDTFEGAPPLNPWFKILRVRGDKWFSIQVTDVNKSCSSEAVCQKYLSSAPLVQKLKVNSADYQTYNEFIELISTLKP